MMTKVFSIDGQNLSESGQWVADRTLSNSNCMHLPLDGNTISEIGESYIVILEAITTL